MDQFRGTPEGDYAGRSLGIAGLVLGVIAVVLAFIPCIGLLSLFPGVVGIVLSGIAVAQSRRLRLRNGIAVSGLVCSVIACAIAIIQLWVLQTASVKMQEGYEMLEKSGQLDSLSSRISSLEVIADSLWESQFREEEK